MEQLFTGIEDCVAKEAWMGALFMTLAIPDICGRIDSPTVPSGRRYAAWFNAHLAANYTVHRPAASFRPAETKVFLSGDDCYALRCAMLHEGRTDITGQRARDSLDAFIFVVPPPGLTIHCNIVDNRLQLQVSEFCREVVAAARAWLGADPMRLQACSDLIQLNIAQPGESFRF